MSMWTQSEEDGTTAIHLMNRSPDPVSDVAFSFLANRDFSQIDPVGFYFELIGVPACSDLTFQATSLRYRKIAYAQRDPVMLPSSVNVREKGMKRLGPHWLLIPTSVSFTDRDGQSWTRDDSGALRHDPDGGGRGWGNYKVEFEGMPVAKPVTVCGANGG
ncbi:hypothetical protein [Streptomyces lutosisoli]|uniref:Uncharacterized protein n=1 Tax=Streptomyces lutosisoli TaxID=2665721 RepID=A0ABW2VZ51_9ACTN